jgi:phenylpyruvate tautomerase PptA (4-oxalocrotonate tautomerase family)
MRWFLVFTPCLKGYKLTPTLQKQQRRFVQMPYLRIETNQRFKDADQNDFLKKASALIAESLGKPENWVMICFQPNAEMMFGGSEKPAAFVELKSIGLPTEQCGVLSDRICTFLEKALNLSSDRVFIEFKSLERPMFGWNRKTF